MEKFKYSWLSAYEELRKSPVSSIYIIGANSTPANYVVNSKYADEYIEFPSAVDDRI